MPSELRQRGVAPSHTDRPALTQVEQDTTTAASVSPSSVADTSAAASSPSAPTSSISAPSPSSSTGAARLKLPASLRETFEKKRQELLQKHPDILNDTVPSSTRSSSTSAPNSVHWGFRLDMLVLGLAFLLLCWGLYTEYHINVPLSMLNFLRNLLDPGPIQRAEEEEEGTSAEAVQAAIQAVHQRMRQTHR